MNAIRTENLTKEFDGVVAVDHVNLNIEEGEVFGLLGPNGAGKTTFVSILSTILPPTDGTAEVWGADVRKEPKEVRSTIGIVFQDPSLDDRLTGWENLDFHGRIYGVPKEDRERQAEELLKLVDLERWADKLVMKYSGGMRRRLELVRGMIHEPKVLLLDEPTLGLDPQTRRKVWEYIRNLNDKNGTTMILTTHYMEEADYLCDRVGIIDRGEIVALGTPKHLRSELKGDIVVLELPQPEKFTEIFESEEAVNRVEVVDGSLHLQVKEGEKALPKILEIANEHSGEVRSAGLRKPTLEDVFIRYTGRTIREGEANGEGIRLRVRSRRRR